MFLAGLLDGSLVDSDLHIGVGRILSAIVVRPVYTALIDVHNEYDIYISL
jgi:hypothetical protein